MAELSRAEGGVGAWLPALLVATGMQAILAMMTRVLPAIGPAATDLAGVSAEKIGYLAAFCSFGTMIFLLWGAPLLRRFGPVRLLQAGALLSAAAMALGASGTWLALLVASFAVGVGYAPSAPAGSEILLHRAPARRRSLMFSVKQSGVPLGGVIAGAVLPPLLLIGGVEAALVGSGAIAAAAVLAVQPWRGGIDGPRLPGTIAELPGISPLGTLVRPFQLILSRRTLAIATGCGFSFALAQGALFTFFVTFLAETTDYSLVRLGMAFAVMQGVGVVSRVGVGWLADLIGSPRLTLAALGFGSAATMVLLAAIGPDWPWWTVVAVAGISGFAVASWNGVMLGEISALAPPDRVGEVTSAATFCIFTGYTLSPVAVSLLVAWSGSYSLGMVAAAVPPAIAGCLLFATRADGAS